MNNLLPLTFPSDRALPRTVLVSKASFCSLLLTRAVYNYIHNYQHLLTREPQNEIHNVLMT